MSLFEKIRAISESALLYKAMLISYGLFYVGFFLVPREFENYHQGFFYGGIAVVGLLLLPRGWALLRRNALFWILSIYLLYMAGSGFWSEVINLDPEAVKRTFKLLERAGYIIVFFMISAAVRDRDREGFDRMLMVVCLAAAISAVVTLLLWYSEHPFPESRVWGFSLVRWTIFAAYSFGVFAVLAVYYMIRCESRWMSLALGVAFLTLFTYVWLSQSRMAFGATLLGVLVVAMGSKSRDRFWVLLLVGLGVGVTSVLLIPDAVDHVASRGFSFRPQIWMVYIERAMAAPIFGEGLLSDPQNYVFAPPFDGMVPDAHSAYIGTLRDGGVIGLGLLLAGVAVALWRGVLGAMRSGCYLALAVGLEVAGFIATDTDRLITRTGGQWIFLWLPMILIMTNRIERPDPVAPAPGTEKISSAS